MSARGAGDEETDEEGFFLMDAIQAMCTRRSIRKYTADPVKEEDLRKILDCGRLAPTGVNRQAWRFIVVTDAAVKAAVAEATDYGKFIASAPVVIAVAIGPDAACPNEDSAAAACNMLNAAHALGYGGCWIGLVLQQPADAQQAGTKMPHRRQIVVAGPALPGAEEIFLR